MENRGRSAKDLWLLNIVSNWNTDESERLLKKLRSYAKFKARQQVPYTHIEDAALTAVDKAVNWLMSGAPPEAPTPPGPWIYLLTLIKNDVIDYRRTLRDEEYGLFIERGSDKDTGYHVIGDRKKGKIGFREAQGREIAQLIGPEVYEELYRPPPTVATIYGLRKTRDWLLYYNEAIAQVIGVRDFTDEVEKEAAQLLKDQRRQRWWQYNHITGLLKSIKRPREREIMGLLLWGYRQVDIAGLLDISEARISIVTSKWKRIWSWDKTCISKSRIFMLTHYLAMAYMDYVDEPIRNDIPRFIGRRGLLNLEDELSGEGEWEKESRVEVQKICKHLYDRVINVVEMKPYFFDLKQSQTPYLLHACLLCYKWWYAELDIE